MIRILLYTCLFAALAFLLWQCDPMSYNEYRMEAYDGAFTWEEVTPKAAWSNRYDHAAVAFDGKLWVLGGYDSGRLKGDSYLEDVWSSSDGRNWELVTEKAPWKGRRGHTVTVFDDGNGEAMYLVGGYEVDESSGYRQYTNDAWKSTDGKQWTRIRERSYLPDQLDADFLPRFNHVCVTATHGGAAYLYLIGGATMLEEQEGTYAFYYFHDVWRSADGANWEKLDNDNFGQRSEHAACTDPATGRIYMHGGLFGFTFDNEEMHHQPGANYHDIWYSDDGISWMYEEVDTLARAGHGLVSYGDALWMLPGKSESNHLRFAYGNLYYTYTRMAGDEWILDSKGSAFNARHSYATALFQGKLWVLGGETADNGPNNDVWCGTLENQ